MKKRNSTTKIILHCSATKEGMDFNVNDIRRWHKERKFEDVGYHYVIKLDGTIQPGRPEEMVGAHCLGQNQNSIGICYIGGCDQSNKPKDTRTLAQKTSLKRLVKQMLDKYKLNIDSVFGHYQFANKACPSFDINEFKQDFLTTYPQYE